MTYACLSCKKPLSSRISPLCSWCGAKVPTELLFTESEKRRIEDEESEARKRIGASGLEKKLKAEDDLWRISTDGIP